MFFEPTLNQLNLEPTWNQLGTNLEPTLKTNQGHISKNVHMSNVKYLEDRQP